MLEFLPQKLKNALKYVNANYVYELRLRADKPTTINYHGKYLFLMPYGVSDNVQNAICLSKSEIESVVYSAGKFSVYSIEEQIKQGFISAEGGVRIGIAGEYVLEKGQPLTIRNISSLCIRVPHEVIDAGKDIFTRYMSDRIVNVLVASLPGCGKTTILRDLARLISQTDRKNVLICDERGELSFKNVGDTCDILLYADKLMAFEAGIRAMRPDVIITDELSVKDVMVMDKLFGSGVQVIASIHAKEINQLPQNCFDSFDVIVFLKAGAIGEIEYIYEKRDGKLELSFPTMGV